MIGAAGADFLIFFVRFPRFFCNEILAWASPYKGDTGKVQSDRCPRLTAQHEVRGVQEPAAERRAGGGEQPVDGGQCAGLFIRLSVHDLR